MGSDSFVDNKILCGVTHDLKEELFHFSHHKPYDGCHSKSATKLSNHLAVVRVDWLNRSKRFKLPTGRPGNKLVRIVYVSWRNPRSPHGKQELQGIIALDIR
jgi:hypothetical protein